MNDQGTSRLSLAVPAVRGPMKARMLLSAPPGGGKTRSGLIAATVLAGGDPFVVIDTERNDDESGAALTFADDFTFKHIMWRPPFDPFDLAATIAEAGEQFAVVQIDSFTHFWKGDGGILDIADGKFGGWKTARPAHADLIDAILGCKAHVILCAREKMAHAQEKNEKTGKIEVKKLGMEVQQDGDLEYEMNVSLTLDKEHIMTVSKSRTTALPVGRTFQPGHVEDMARIYLDWLNAGEPPASIAVVEALRARVGALPAPVRKACVQEFKAELGPPDQLRESLVEAAETLVARFEAAARVEGSAPDQAPGGDGGEAEPGGSSVSTPQEPAPEPDPEPNGPGGGGEPAPALALDGGGDNAEIGEGNFRTPQEPVPAAKADPMGAPFEYAPQEPTGKLLGPKRAKALHIFFSNRGCAGTKTHECLALLASNGRTRHFSELLEEEELVVRREGLRLAEAGGDAMRDFVARVEAEMLLHVEKAS